MTSFVFFFLHISDLKVRDFAILDCCPDDKNHKYFSQFRIYAYKHHLAYIRKTKISGYRTHPDRLLSPHWSSFGTILL